MKTSTVLPGVVCAIATSLAGAAQASPIPLPDFHHIFINVSNDAGARVGSGPDDSYYIKADGGGLNQLHITTDTSLAGLNGQVTTKAIASSSTSGRFWITTTGGRGYNDDIILLLSLVGPIADDFSLSVRSSGYQWTPTANAIGADEHYVADAVNETFVASDFLYGPQTTKPGPGTGTLPFYSGQNIADPATAAYLMFIDLNLGNTSFNRASHVDNGNVRVDFQIAGLYSTIAAFNAYAFAFTSNTGDNSIDWTNRLSSNLAEAGQSGYSIQSTAIATPEPGTLVLLGTGLGGLVLRRRNLLGAILSSPGGRDGQEFVRGCCNRVRLFRGHHRGKGHAH